MSFKAKYLNHFVHKSKMNLISRNLLITSTTLLYPRKIIKIAWLQRLCKYNKILRVSPCTNIFSIILLIHIDWFWVTTICKNSRTDCFVPDSNSYNSIRSFPVVRLENCVMVTVISLFPILLHGRTQKWMDSFIKLNFELVI